MKAMILAAGRGDRLRPLTDTTPKPLINVAGIPLIEHHINNLHKAGINDIIINTAWLANKIHKALGDGSQYGVSISYSDETEALETAGGIINALPLLGKDSFLVVNGDIWSDFDFSNLPTISNTSLAHLILVNNPSHNKAGDFSILNGLLKNAGETMFTYSGIGIYCAEFFAKQIPDGQTQKKLPLAPIIRNHCECNTITAEHYSGKWTDVGTIDRLEELEKTLAK